MKHKHYDIIVAWAEGKDIQWNNNGVWHNVSANPFWYDFTEYRIKPNSVACPRCGKVHTCDPVDTDKIAKKQAKYIFDAIDADVLKKLYDLSTAGMRKPYYEREADYCREEIEAFNHDPSEENRYRVLAKRSEFKKLWRGNVL
jgi:hypothetical protein